MFRSHMSLSFGSSLASKIGDPELLQSSPLHPSHAATHFKPLFRQEHKFVPQTFLDDILHLPRMIIKIFSGAASLSVISGNNIIVLFFHPHSSGLSALMISKLLFDGVLSNYENKQLFQSVVVCAGRSSRNLLLPYSYTCHTQTI